MNGTCIRAVFRPILSLAEDLHDHVYKLRIVIGDAHIMRPPGRREERNSMKHAAGRIDDMKQKAVLIGAILSVICLAVPVSNSAAGPVFTVRPLTTMTVSAGGPYSAWRCGEWYGWDWKPAYFSAEWAPWDWPGVGPESYVNWMLGGGYYNWYGWCGPYSYWGGDYIWTGWYSLYRGYLPDPWMYGHLSRDGRSHAHPGPKPVIIHTENPRRGGASRGGEVHRRRPPVTDAPPTRVPRGRPHVTPRPRSRPMPRPMPSPSPVVRSVGHGGRHRR